MISYIDYAFLGSVCAECRSKRMSSNEQNEGGANSEPQNSEMEISMVTEVVEEAAGAEVEHDR